MRRIEQRKTQKRSEIINFENIINMKYYFLTFVFLIFCSTFIHGQDNKLIYSKQVSSAVEKSKNKNGTAKTKSASRHLHTQISASDFSTGTYFLTILSTNQTITEKIIFNK